MQYKVIEYPFGRTVIDGINTLEEACSIAAEREMRTGREHRVETDFKGGGIVCRQLNG